MEKRPATGIWAGLYCLPVFESRDALRAALPAKAQSRLQDGEPFLALLDETDLIGNSEVVLMTGHASLETTDIYTHVSIDKLIAVHKATHPSRLQRRMP